MRYFPVNLDIRGCKVIIVGGGSVASRKCVRLVDAGAAVTVIAPEISEQLRDMAGNGSISFSQRTYTHGDLSGAVLVFAATDNREANCKIAEDAKSMGIAVNVADDPDVGTFALPAVITRGELLITVSTGGRSPALAAEIRRELEGLFGGEYAVVTAIMGAVREKLLTEKAGNAYNKSLLNVLAAQDLPYLAAHGAFAEIDSLLVELFGPGYTLAELGVREKDSE